MLLADDTRETCSVGGGVAFSVGVCGERMTSWSYLVQTPRGVERSEVCHPLLYSQHRYNLNCNAHPPKNLENEHLHFLIISNTPISYYSQKGTENCERETVIIYLPQPRQYQTIKGA